VTRTLVLALAALLLVVMVSFWVVSFLFGLFLKLVFAAIVGALADAIVPGRMPYGLLGAVGAGLVGGLLGSLLLAGVGPNGFPFEILKTFVGTLAVVAIATAVYASTERSRRA
jgi:uncharacterized membrane protein YeaQ/YmgE (transglycosylase-associated protein family)